MATLGYGLFISLDKIVESENMTTNDVGKAVLFKWFSELFEEQRVDWAKLTSAKKG